jgi:hypothetical protein
VLNNGAGTGLNGTVSISDMLSLQDGILDIGSSMLTILAGARIVGGSEDSYLLTSGAGEICQMGIGSGGRTNPVLFPVGNGQGYTPFTLINFGVMDQFCGRVAAAVLENGSSGSPISQHVVNRSWFLREGQTGGSNANLTVEWNGGDEAASFNRTSCYIAHYDNGQWLPLQQPDQASGILTFSRSVSGISDFHIFAVGDAQSPLPLDLLAFETENKGSEVRLRWLTSGESNTLGFGIERKISGADTWNEIHFLHAHGDGWYEFIDHPRATAIAYRLRIVDLDGSFSLSPEKVIVLDPDIPLRLSVTATPNPFGEYTMLRFTLPRGGRTTLLVLDVMGRVVRTIVDASLQLGTHSRILDLAGLPNGMYQCILRNEDTFTGTRLILVR